MTSYRPNLLFIIGVTSLGFAPISVASNLEYRIEIRHTHELIRRTSLESHPPKKMPDNKGFVSSLSQEIKPQSLGFINHSQQFPTLGTSNLQVAADFSGTLEIAENQDRSKKNLFWMGLIGFSTLLGAGIFAGLFYMLTSSSWEREETQSEIAEALDDRKNPGNDSFDSNSENNSENNSDKSLPADSKFAQQNINSDPTSSDPPIHKNLSELPQNLPDMAAKQSFINPHQTTSSQITPSEEVQSPSAISQSQQAIAHKISEDAQNLSGNGENSTQEPETQKTPSERVQTPTSIYPNNSQGVQTKRQSSQTSTDDLNDHIHAENRKVVESSEVPEPSQKDTQSLAIKETTRLAKIDIIEELMRDLQSPDPTKRRKSIWELGQRGDSRAVQPLVDLIMDSDSKQVSLILGALSEIGTRTLKPMNRALALSLQDQNPDVRKNAIRDLTRIYDLVSQISQLLRHAADDSDVEVQETARWALNQLSQINTMSNYQSRSALHNWTHPVDHSPEDLS